MACQSSDTSLNEFTDDNLSFLDMELEALQSIFLNELEVKEDENFTTVSIDLYPSTADKLDEQYVRMTLQFILNEEYPEEIPKINIRNPRGLSDEELNSITQDLLTIAESKQGNSMLFEMIDAAREHLTVGNRPSGECAICLHGFSDNDAFTKTECYHYFHSHCLARYAKNFFENPRNSEDDAENKVKSDELLCPMCRIPIEFDEWNVDYPPPEESDESNFTLSEEIIELQKKMAALFQKQVQQGGIIDVEAEKNKYLLEISNVSARSDSEEKSELKSAAEGDSVIESKNEQSDEIDSPAHDRKDYVKDRSRNFDHRGKNRNFRPIDNRSNNRYGQRYVKQSFNRGNYNKYRYGKQSSENSYQDESEIPQNFETKDSLIPQDIAESEDLMNSSSDMVEPNDASEMLESASPTSKAKYNPNFSPRYKNRGYYHGRNNYNYDGRRSGRGSYNEQRNSQPSHRYSAQRTEDSSSKFEKRFENDLRTHDHDNYKPDYRSGNYRHDNGYYGKQRYNDSRNNSHHGFKGAYSGRDAYSNSYNSRGNRYADSKDRDQYAERNYRENRYTASKDRDQYPDRNYRENKYTDSKDRDQHSERNYKENRYADCKDRDQYAERNYRENRYTASKDRDLNSERNYKENRYADSKDRDQNPERNYKENRYADSKDRDQNPERNYKENRYADSKDRDQNPERNYKENRYADSKDRDQNPERNYKENRYADSKDRDQNPERNYKENRYADSKDRDQNRERNYKENRYADSKDRDQNPERNYKENKYADSKDRDQNPERNYRENRYVDSKDRAQYPAKNFREKRTYRDVKYKNSEDAAYNKSRQGTRNYSGSRPERYSDRLYAEPSNVKSESLELNNQNQNGETLTAENSSTNLPSNSSQGEKSLPKKDLTDFEEKSSSVVSAFNSSSSNILPNAFCENADVASRTVNPPPGFANPLKKVVYGLQGANPPPGFNRS